MGKRKRPAGLAPVAVVQRGDVGTYRLTDEDRQLVAFIAMMDVRCRPVINWDRFRFFGWDVRLPRPVSSRSRSAVD